VSSDDLGFNEALLVDRAKQGDRDAFSALIEKHASAVLTVAWRIVGNRALAEDVAQETFMAAFRALPNFRADARFSTWLYRIAVNKCRDALRSKTAVKETDTLDGENTFEPALRHAQGSAGMSGVHRTPEEQLMDKHRATRITEALGELSPVYREAFVLRHVEGLSYEEMSEVLGIEGSTLRMRVYKARQDLSRSLAELAVR
jgi:RNA polymerase sigma-70 factor (ECF subfamily)